VRSGFCADDGDGGAVTGACMAIVGGLALSGVVAVNGDVWPTASLAAPVELWPAWSGYRAGGMLAGNSFCSKAGGWDTGGAASLNAGSGGNSGIAGTAGRLSFEVVVAESGPAAGEFEVIAAGAGEIGDGEVEARSVATRARRSRRRAKCLWRWSAAEHPRAIGLRRLRPVAQAPALR
jgi:hypothetical protein